MGLRIQTVTDDIAESLGLKDQHGALVAEVTAGGPAAKAGIKAGDVVINFDGKDVSEMRRLPRLVAETPIGKEVDVVVWRDNKKVTVRATVAELKETEDADQGKPAEKPTSKKDGGQTVVPSLGLSIAPITPELRDRFSLPSDAKGIVVTDVKGSGQAAEKGIRPGDVIAEVSRDAVKTPSEFVQKVEEARKGNKKSVLLLIQNDSGLHYVPLRVDSPDSADKKDKKDKE